MLNFVKKDCNIYAPVEGRCMDIVYAREKTFAEKMLGDGFLIIPEKDVISSPGDGILTMVADTKHAFGITLANGIELLVHIGIDTVDLKGEGFIQLVEQNVKVRKGTPVISCDRKMLREKGYDISVFVITVGKNFIEKQHLGEKVKKLEVIIET